MRVLLLGVQIPFARGGAERLLEDLRLELERAGHATDVVTLPFNDVDRPSLLASCGLWRGLSLDSLHDGPIDRVIATKFPSYWVRHPSKVVWLVHQYRGAYDFSGTSYTNLKTDRLPDAATRDAIVEMDGRAFSECRAVYTISETVSDRLRLYNRVESRPLHPPPRLASSMPEPVYGDFVLGVSRLERNKRLDLLIEALTLAQSGVRAVIVGSGSQEAHLRFLAAHRGIEERVRFAGAVDDDELLRLYATCRAVFFAPYEEDYGYVTLEAFAAAKPVVSATDSGGVLEFVVDGVNGLVTEPDPAAVARALDRLTTEPELAPTLGSTARARMPRFSWSDVTDALLA